MDELKVELGITASVNVPLVPNFLMLNDRGHTYSIPVRCFTEEALRKLGAAWTEALVENAKRQECRVEE